MRGFLVKDGWRILMSSHCPEMKPKYPIYNVAILPTRDWGMEPGDIIEHILCFLSGKL